MSETKKVQGGNASLPVKKVQRVDPKKAIKQQSVNRVIIDAKVKPIVKGKKPLCIIGTAGTSKDAPYDMQLNGEEYVYDIWGINTALVKEDVKRLDVCFEMHPKRYWGLPAVTDRLNDFGGRVIMQDHYDEIEHSEAYPRETIKKKYHLDVMGDNIYVTNTITWMLLLALEEGYTDISLYGIHMAHDTEYAYQRASCSWVLGIIHGWILMGNPYKIFIPEESQLLKAEYEYGFDEPTKMMQFLKGRQEGMKNGIQEANNQINSLNISKWKTEGAMSEAQLLYEKSAGWK